MYAIVEIAGQQFKIEKDQQIFVHRLEAKEGSKINFDKVLLMENSGKVNVGAPVIKGAKVTAKVLEHLKDDKVKNGHRQYLTKLEILKIDEKALAAKKPVAKKAPVEKSVAKKPIAKKAPAKKTAAKKPVAKAVLVKKTPAKKAE